MIDPLGAVGPRWYALRVVARRPSLGLCHRLGALAERPPEGPRPTGRDVSRSGAAGAGLPRAGTAGSGALPLAEAPVLPLRAEYVVEAVLARRGIEAWVPVESVFARANRYHRRARQLVLHPMLTGYVLVRMAPGARWEPVLACPLVAGVVGVAGVPMALPDRAVAHLRQEQAQRQAAAQERLMPTRRVYGIGAEVEVLDGPLEGRVMRVVAIAGDLARVVGPFLGGEDVVFEVGLDRIAAV